MHLVLIRRISCYIQNIKHKYKIVLKFIKKLPADTPAGSFCLALHFVKTQCRLFVLLFQEHPQRLQILLEIDELFYNPFHRSRGQNL